MPGRKLLLLAAFCGIASSQTGITTIQDTLFKADGTRFNGTLTIQWNSFDATNLGTVIQQSTNVTVTNGNLLVQLAPNAAAQPPANIYTVSYQTNGKQQFVETWTVPVSSRALLVSEVRTGVLSIPTSYTSNTSSPIPESSVVNLIADLNQRPIMGAGYGANRVAVIDDAGAIESAIGNPGDCVMIDGTTGPCGQPQPAFSDAETPGGLVDGVNSTFTLTNTPTGASLKLFRNGLYMSGGFDYTLTGSTFQFVPGAIPQPGDKLAAFYRVDPTSGGSVANLVGPDSIKAMAAQVLCSAPGASTQSTSWFTIGGCDIAAGALLPGDRIEIQFTLAHTGTAAGFDFRLDWGNTAVVSRHAGNQDAAVTGRATAALTSSGAQLSVESWGTVLSFLPGLLNAPSANGLRVAWQAQVNSAADSVALLNYTVLRYPAN